jgi:hypothetical protein
MRILHRNIKVSKIIFHPFSAVLYFLAFLYFFYLNYKLFPMWTGVQDRLFRSKEIYEKKLLKKEKVESKQEILGSDEGQKRYRKEFFNELDEGEKLIILYSNLEEEKEKEVEEVRQLSFFSKLRQNIKVWWANF